MTHLTAGRLATLLLLAASSCTQADLGDPAGPDLNDYLGGLPQLPTADEVPPTPIDCNGQCPGDGQEGELYCTYARYGETAHLRELVALQPDSASLWPGAVVQGGDAVRGLFTPVGVPRAPLTFSVSLENLGGTPVGTMSSPSLSSFREERNRILAQGVTGATPAALDFEISEVYSESQLSVALGASVDWPGGPAVSASFDFDSSEQRTKMLVDFTQAYYTIDVDAPTRPADFFDPSVSVGEIAPYVGDDNPPLYVQSITYGRRVLFSIESSESARSVRAALEAAFDIGVAGVGAKLDVEHERVLRESTIHAFVLGGSGADAVGVIGGYEGLVDYITSGGDYSADSPGAPIAYKLAYLDSAAAELSLATEYTERRCVRNRATVRAELEDLTHVSGGDVGSNIELYGTIAVRLPTADSPVIDCQTGGVVVPIWHLDEGQWLSMPEYSTWTPATPVYADVEEVAVGPDQQMCIYAHLWDEDYSTGELSGDDDYGYAERLISFDRGWGGEQVLQLRGSGDAGVDVRLKMTVE